MNTKNNLYRLDKKHLKGSLYLLNKRVGLGNLMKILGMNKNPIIIGGCGRSGTTLMLSLMSVFDHVFTIPVETGAFCKSSYTENPDKKENINIYKIYDYILSIDKLNSISRWCEKTPKNVQRINEIINYFGNDVKIINMVRDGRDVITSVHPTKDNAYWVSKERWVSDVEAGYKYEKSDKVITVRYEDLITDFEKELKKICLFIGESYTSEFSNYPNSARLKTNIAWFGKAQKIHNNSIKRWKEPEFQSRIEDLMKDDKAVSFLKHYKYI